MLSSEEIRNINTAVLLKKGFSISENLPLLESSLYLKNKDQIINRALCLNVIVASSFNASFKKNAVEWLKDNEVLFYLTDKEKAFLDNQFFDTSFFQIQQECLYSFGWMLGLINDIDIEKQVPIELVFKFPNLKEKETSFRFKTSAKMRDKEDIIKMLDFYYCLDWAITDSVINRKRSLGKLPPVVIKERRKALEWALGTDYWDDVALDT